MRHTITEKQLFEFRFKKGDKVQQSDGAVGYVTDIRPTMAQLFAEVGWVEGTIRPAPYGWDSRITILEEFPFRIGDRVVCSDHRETGKVTDIRLDEDLKEPYCAVEWDFPGKAQYGWRECLEKVETMYNFEVGDGVVLSNAGYGGASGGEGTITQVDPNGWCQVVWDKPGKGGMMPSDGYYRHDITTIQKPHKWAIGQRVWCWEPNVVSSFGAEGIVTKLFPDDWCEVTFDTPSYMGLTPCPRKWRSSIQDISTKPKKEENKIQAAATPELHGPIIQRLDHLGAIKEVSLSPSFLHLSTDRGSVQVWVVMGRIQVEHRYECQD